MSKKNVKSRNVKLAEAAKTIGVTSNITTNWSLLFKDNKQAVKDFANGDCGLRSMINSLTSEEARAEAYRLERYVGATTARNRAKKALSRTR